MAELNSKELPDFSILIFSLMIIVLSAWITTCPAQDLVVDSESGLYVDPGTQDFSNNTEVLERIKASPHGYFRFINIIFRQKVCRLFQESFAGTPSFNLHGDAHIEQYAVTDLGRGLTDFDDSSTGPAILDLMRFGVSLHLTCRELGWADRAEELYNRFLLGYRNALIDPDTMAPEPELAKQIRSKFTIARQAYFEWVDTIMEPMPDEERQELLAAMQTYIEVKSIENPVWDQNYFKVEKVGYLRMGIGSALDLKYLARIRGLTDDPNDDLALEIKEVRDLSGIDCITTKFGDPFRVLLGQARIAYQPFKHLGYFRFKGINFWVHSWVDNYQELNITESFQSEDDLAEVAYDIGFQLGLGHIKHIASPLDLQLRREQILLLNRDEAIIKQSCTELAAVTVVAWEKFCARLESD